MEVRKHTFWLLSPPPSVPCPDEIEKIITHIEKTIQP